MDQRVTEGISEDYLVQVPNQCQLEQVAQGLAH